MRGVWIAVLTTRLLTAADFKTVADLQGVHARQRVIVGSVTEEAFDKMALELLGRDTVTLGKLVDYGSVQDQVAAGPRGFDHCSYGHWRAVADAYAKSHSGCPVVKEAVKIGANIVVRTVGQDCQRTQRVLQGGADPLRVKIDGENVDLLGVELGPLTSAAQEQRITWHVYARTRPPITAELAKALTSRLIRLAGEDTISVALRPDAWFVTECGFPAVYPFEDRGRVPALGELAAAQSAVCSNFTTTGKIQCSSAAR
jgi:hypothetical protein